MYMHYGVMNVRFILTYIHHAPHPRPTRKNNNRQKQKFAQSDAKFFELSKKAYD